MDTKGGARCLLAPAPRDQLSRDPPGVCVPFLHPWWALALASFVPS